MNKSASDLPKFPLETIRDVSDDMELCDSVSDISSIAHNASALSSSVAGASVAPSCSSAAANLSVVEARSVLSPMMRSLKVKDVCSIPLFLLCRELRLKSW